MSSSTINHQPPDRYFEKGGEKYKRDSLVTANSSQLYGTSLYRTKLSPTDFFCTTQTAKKKERGNSAWRCSLIGILHVFVCYRPIMVKHQKCV